MRYEAYVDGSFKEVKGVGAFYASAAIIAPEGSNNWAQMTKVSADELISMRNVAGEIMAVMLVMEHCLNTLNLKQGDYVLLHYDYAGIENWVKPAGSPGYWRCKNPTTQAYRDYMQRVVGPRFKVEFDHTPGHTGIVGNEIVDRLAKEALDRKFAEILA